MFMTEKPFIDWLAMSDKAIIKHIAAFIKHHRLEQNKTQTELAKEAGISRSTLSLLERGKTVTLSTFIQVLRVLDLLSTLNTFEIIETISPLELAKLQKRKPQKARRKRKK